MARKTMDEILSEEWDRTFRTNITAMFYLCRAAEPHLKPGSSIINTILSKCVFTKLETAIAICSDKRRYRTLPQI